MPRIAIAAPLMFLALASCVNFVRPSGDWANAVQLNLDNQSLENIVIGVECGQGSFDGNEWTPAVLAPCREIVSLVKTMGATVEADEALLPLKATNDKSDEEEESKLDTLAKPLITVTYVDRDYKTDWCGWTLLPTIGTFWLFPCVVDSEHRAELLIHADNGDLLDRRFLRNRGKGYYGALALPILAAKYAKRILRGSSGKGDNMRSLYSYIRNAVYTGYTRRALQQTAEAYQATDRRGQP